MFDKNEATWSPFDNWMGCRMPRLAKGREVYLTSEEIAREALHQFDVSPRPLSMRALAKALGVAPPSIYHYFATEEDIIRAAVTLVFQEAINDYVSHAGDPLTNVSDPEELLISTGLVLKRTFARHFRIAPYMASAPQPTSTLAGLLAIYGSALEQLGVTGSRAGEAMFAWGNYVYGSILVSASRRVADEKFNDLRAPFSTAESRPEDAPIATEETSQSLDRAIASAGASSDEEEAFFLAGLRIFIAGMRAEAALS